MTKIIGITGLIASGKSTLTKYLLEKGYKVFDADKEVKDLYSEENFLNKLKIIFPDVFINNNIDKSLLAKLIFSNKNEKEKLEKLIHPLIEKKCDIFINTNQLEKTIFLDVPLLFEVGWNKKCNEIITIILDKDIQKERYINRGGDISLFDKILENEGDIEFKKSNSTYIIDNNGNLEDFYKKVNNILSNVN